MANWKHRIELHDLFVRYGDDEITVEEVGRETAERIKKCPAFQDDDHQETLEDIALMMENVEVEDDFDYALNALFDWGDVNSCWVNVSFATESK